MFFVDVIHNNESILLDWWFDFITSNFFMKYYLVFFITKSFYKVTNNIFLKKRKNVMAFFLPYMKIQLEKRIQSINFRS